MIVRVKKLLLFVTVTGDWQLYLAHQTIIDLSVDHDISGAQTEPILDSHDFKLFSIILAFKE